jgi:thiol:disulfide interchange protein
MRHFKFIIALCGLISLLPCAPTGCATAHNKTADQIYDPSADGEQQLRIALARAQKEHKHVLLNLGANWCSDSQALYRLLREDPAIRGELRQHFILVMVDVNQKDGPLRNHDMVERLGNPLTRGIPVLLVLDTDGKLLNHDAAERLTDDAHKRPAEVLAYLRKWGATPP